MVKLAVVLIAAALLVAPSMGRILDRCSLAREMSGLGVPRDQLDKWACIAQHESGFNTDAVGTMNSNGSQDYGIFQINNAIWCQPPSGYSTNACHIACTAFLVDSIEPATRCAQQVLSQQGWTAWSTWHFCSGYVQPVDDCFAGVPAPAPAPAPAPVPAPAPGSGGLLSGIVQQVKNGVNGVENQVNDAMNNINNLKNQVNGAIGALPGTGAIVNGINGAMNNANGVKNQVENQINSAVNNINSLGGQVNQAVNNIQSVENQINGVLGRFSGLHL